MSLITAFELDRIRKEMAEECMTVPGKEINAALEPDFSRLIMKRERDRLAEALACCEQFGRIPLDGISDQRKLLEMAKRGRTLSASDLLQEIRLIRGIRNAVAYEKTIHELPHEEIHDLFTTLIIHDKTEQKLSRCISDYGEVRDSASEHLKEIRRNLRESEALIADGFDCDHPEWTDRTSDQGK